MADYGHGQVDLEDISLLAQEKCQAAPTIIDARRNRLLGVVSNRRCEFSHLSAHK